MTKTETKKVVRNLITNWLTKDKGRARTKLGQVSKAYKNLRKNGKLPDTLFWSEKQLFLWKIVTSYHHLDAGGIGKEKR